MSYTVGLDFGTHQTKVCIEDASNPAQKIYDFFEFKDGENEDTLLFPSLIQINKDDTVSYGFGDEEKCKYLQLGNDPKPILKLPIKPELILPNKPNKKNYPQKPDKGIKTKLSWKEQLLQLKRHNTKLNPDYLQWEEVCEKIDDKYKIESGVWKFQCKELNSKHKESLEEWQIEDRNKREEYQTKFNTWSNHNKEERMRYHYFKLATFSESFKYRNWNYHIKPEVLSVWYLAYVLLSIQEKYGEEFFTQMGIPSGLDKDILKKQEMISTAILLTAYKIVDKYKNLKTFTSVKYTDLIEDAQINYNFEEEDKMIYGVEVLPEAFAGLTSVTKHGRISLGMNLLVDIGGGTTDIAFFTTTKESLPNIHSVISFDKGLNFIFEGSQKNFNNKSLSEIQKIFFESKGNDRQFSSSLRQYEEDLERSGNDMLEKLFSSYNNKQNKRRIDRLIEALEGRPILYCGGGSLYENMRTSIYHFQDQRLIDKDLLNIPTIKNKKIKKELFTILATSYGLSIPIEEKPKMEGMEKLFEKIPTIGNDNSVIEYGLQDY